MVTTRTVATFGLALAAIGLLLSQDVVRASSRTIVAYSLGAARTRVERAVQRGGDWRRTTSALTGLGGITRPWAVVIDRSAGDVILVGDDDPTLPPLTLDHFAAAMRARVRHPDEDPGVTIDPRGSARAAAVQDVRFFGGVEGTRFGLVCFRSDWLMKRIGLGLERVNAPGLQVYYDLSIDEARSRTANRVNVGSRFWFYPIVTRVHVFPDVVLLERFQMGVFTQLMYAEVDGRPVADLDRFEHRPSETFSRSFSEHYDEIARSHEDLETLRGLTRLAALAKGLTRLEGAAPALDYYVQRYPIEAVETPREMPVLRAAQQDAQVEISGGVTLSALAMKAQGGDPDALRDLVLAARPSANEVTWRFSLTDDTTPKVVLAPPTSTDTGDLGQLFVHGEFLFQQRRYDLAIACWRQVVRSAPEAADVYFRIGDAFERKGMKAAAADYYTKGLAARGSRPTLEPR